MNYELYNEVNMFPVVLQNWAELRVGFDAPPQFVIWNMEVCYCLQFVIWNFTFCYTAIIISAILNYDTLSTHLTFRLSSRYFNDIFFDMFYTLSAKQNRHRNAFSIFR